MTDRPTNQQTDRRTERRAHALQTLFCWSRFILEMNKMFLKDVHIMYYVVFEGSHFMNLIDDHAAEVTAAT